MLMNIDDHFVMKLAKERIDEAVRAAEQTRAIRAGQPHRSVRHRLGIALVRFGRWMQD
jgi:hypothetical protein